jgi:uncharacterized protein
MTDTVPATPYLAEAAAAELEDWGPLEEATGEPMQTSGISLWQDGEQESGVTIMTIMVIWGWSP